MLTNQGTPFSEHGWGLVIADLRRLSLKVEGGSNDMNAGAIDADQETLTTGDPTLVGSDNLASLEDPATALANLGALAKSANLSDLEDPAEALTNLGALAAVNNLSDVASVATARTNLGVEATQLAFAARGTGSSLTEATETDVIPSVEHYDSGSNYNSSTGVFTAPTAGVYHFHTQAQVFFGNSGDGEAYARLRLKVNGSEVYRNAFTITMDGTVGANGEVTPSISAIISLSANDTVKATIEGSYPPGLISSTYWQFEGFRLRTA